MTTATHRAVPEPAAPAAPDAPGASSPRRAVVLLVEDDAADAELTREALAESGRGVELHVVADGIAALAFLRHLAPHTDAPTPDLILLDLNLPGLDGRGVLAEVKQDPALHDIPIVVLSSSAAPDDVASAYALRANCYVTKPVGLTHYLSTIRSIERFWMVVATPPPPRPR